MTHRTVVQTDRPWPDDLVERGILELAGLELVAGPAAVTTPAVITGLVEKWCPAAIMTCWAPVTAATIGASPGLRIVARMGVGLDNIDVEAASGRGVLVTNVPDYCIDEVSDHAIGMVLDWTRGLHVANSLLRSGGTNPTARLRRLRTLTCGIVGYGRIGRATARKLAGFGCGVLATSTHRPADQGAAEWVPLDELLAASDVVILNAPLTPSTAGMIGAAQLRPHATGSPAGQRQSRSPGPDCCRRRCTRQRPAVRRRTRHLGGRTRVPRTSPAFRHRHADAAYRILLGRLAHRAARERSTGGRAGVARRTAPAPLQFPTAAHKGPLMTTTPRIASVHARQILDSRGRPTVEVEIILDDGSVARASVPSGASTGSHEAHELRDGNPADYAGLGVHRAVASVRGEINDALRGFHATDQRGLDTVLRELDGTGSLSRLGANAVLGTSLAVCRAAAASLHQPLYRRIADLAGVDKPLLPMPMVNILSGGLHAGRGMDVQDFLVIPAAATSTEEALQQVERVRSAGMAALVARGLPTLLADEGGLSPGLASGREALSLMVEIFERAGLEPGREAVIAIDVAAHSLVETSTAAFDLRQSSVCGPSYVFTREGRTRSTADMLDMYAEWVSDFPVVSIEDGLDEDDWIGWAQLTDLLGENTTLVGDDLFTTNSDRVRQGIDTRAANGVLVKVNQNGTLSGTLDVVKLARDAGFSPIVSARSGETEDSFLADLAVGTAAGQIKVGSVRCSDRLAKYNQLIRISEDRSVDFAQAVLRGRVAGVPA